MTPAANTAIAPEAPSRTLQRLVRRRGGLQESYERARRTAALHLGGDAGDEWARLHLRLYETNAGPALMEALWRFEARILPTSGLEGSRRAGAGARDLCRNCGARTARAALEAATSCVAFGGNAEPALAWLEVLAWAGTIAGDTVDPLILDPTGQLRGLAPPDLRAFVEDGVRLYPREPARRRAYVRLSDPLARERLAHHAGRSRFAFHEQRLDLVCRALFAAAPQARVVDGTSLCGRTRLTGAALLVPDTELETPADRADDFFEAMMLHAAAHHRFTGERFADGTLKPVQRALVGLLEDARVERLAARAYPGLARLWSGFHTVPASPVQTCASLFARLSRCLADADFHDLDPWVLKGRRLFEEAFAQGGEQSMVRPIASVLGHDLGQLRIPFDARRYRVEPAYRDDGLGLFEEAPGEEHAAPLSLDVEGVRVEDGGPQEPSDTPPEGSQDGRLRPSTGDPGKGSVVARYEEWDERLAILVPEHVAIREHAATRHGGGRLEMRLADRSDLVRRAAGLAARSQLARPRRLRRRVDGEDIDLEAAQEAVLSLRTGRAPDPRVYLTRRRVGRDLSLLLLVDSSQSTGEPVPAMPGETILSTASLATAILGEALSRAGDPFAALAFASDGREDVRITTLKSFEEDAGPLAGRLGGLEPAYSTRLGAVLRHGTHLLRRRLSHRRIMIVITDGEPADIDVDVPGYLEADARQAVAKARGEGLDVVGVALGARADRACATVFGRRNTLFIERIDELPDRLAALYFRLSVS